MKGKTRMTDLAEAPGFRIIRHFDQVSVRVTEIHGGNGPEGAFAPHRPLFHRDTIGFEVIQHFNGRRPGKEAQIRRARKRIVGLREIPLAHFMKIDLTVAERKGGAPLPNVNGVMPSTCCKKRHVALMSATVSTR